MPNMRLRLRIQRNELPTVTTLWPISDTQLKHTVAQTLSRVNDIFPLEAEQWGLEDYTVTVGGYELLHYHEIGAVCKDEDEVVIRPIQYTERRARTLIGRDQITADGRHLVDGVAYGKPALRAPVRPDVRIPPAKRQRLSGPAEDTAECAGEHEVPPLDGLHWLNLAQSALEGLEGPESSEDMDEEDDEDFALVEQLDPTSSSAVSTSGEGSSSSSEGDSSSLESSEVSSDSSSEISENGSDDSSNDDTWDGFKDLTPAYSPQQGSGKTNGLPSSNTNTKNTNKLTESLQAVMRAGQESRKRNAAQAQLDQRRDTETSLLISSSQSLKPTCRPGLQPIEQPLTQPAKLTKPHGGQKKTRERNARRRDQKQLKHLKELHVLPPGAGLKELKQWREVHGWRNRPAGPLSVAGADGEDEDGKMDIDVEAGSDVDATAHVVAAETGTCEDTTSTETLDHLPADEAETVSVQASDTVQKNPKKAPDFEKQRQKLLDSLAFGGVDITSRKSAKKPAAEQVTEAEEDEAPDTMSSKAIDALAAGFKGVSRSAANVTDDADTSISLLGDKDDGKPPEQSSNAKATDMMPPSVSRRSKLDLAGSKRMLFGSLGVRVPETEEEREALQKKLADKAKRPTSPAALNALAVTQAKGVPSPAANAQPADDEDADWRSKLDITAVECCDKGITLITPPFPFHQRWDPQYRKKKNRTQGAYMAGKQRGSKRKADLVEEYDKYFDDGHGDVLNYDDAGDVEDDGYWEEGALLNEDFEDGGAVSRQLTDEMEGAEKKDDFPELPGDISVLPALAEGDAQNGDYIVHKELAVSAATNWQPDMLTRTVLLLCKSGGMWEVKVALRDLAPREYDEEGKRVYSKFEMEGGSDGEDDAEERVKVMRWEEMLEARLLLRPGSAQV